SEIDIKRPFRYSVVMPKHTSKQMIERWQALDAALDPDGDGMIVAVFAENWGISTKQVHRALKLFKKLGYPATPQVTGTQTSMGQMEWSWFYKRGTPFMFARNYDGMEPQEENAKG